MSDKSRVIFSDNSVGNIMSGLSHIFGDPEKEAQARYRNAEIQKMQQISNGNLLLGDAISSGVAFDGEGNPYLRQDPETQSRILRAAANSGGAQAASLILKSFSDFPASKLAAQELQFKKSEAEARATKAQSEATRFNAQRQREESLGEAISQGIYVGADGVTRFRPESVAGILSNTPPENISALINALNDYPSKMALENKKGIKLNAGESWFPMPSNTPVDPVTGTMTLIPPKNQSSGLAADVVGDPVNGVQNTGNELLKKNPISETIIRPVDPSTLFVRQPQKVGLQPDGSIVTAKKLNPLSDKENQDIGKKIEMLNKVASTIHAYNSFLESSNQQKSDQSQDSVQSPTGSVFQYFLPAQASALETAQKDFVNSRINELKTQIMSMRSGQNLTQSEADRAETYLPSVKVGSQKNAQRLAYLYNTIANSLASQMYGMPLNETNVPDTMLALINDSMKFPNSPFIGGFAGNDARGVMPYIPEPNEPGQEIPKSIAKIFMEISGGNQSIAEKLAKQVGWSFSDSTKSSETSKK
jgi:hypothetical protein